jgi:hypothetical protein
MIEKGAVLPMFYLGPVEYFVQLNRYKPDILIEREEHFPKQTYRNRANVYTPDGVLTLVVPVVKGSKTHTKVKDVKISYDHEWQRLHWLSLTSCYRRSAYFEYYEDEFAVFYHNKFEYLFDFNEQLLQFVLKSLKIKTGINYTTEYHTDYPELNDFRNSFNPKKEPSFEPKPYFQVFDDRKGFIKNLSIADLLFNQGPQSNTILGF